MTPGSGRDWEIAEITTQSLGPRYVIELDGDTKVANTVTFNGFRLGLDGRAEVEYTDLEIVDEEYPRGITAKFRDPGGEERCSVDTAKDHSEGSP